MNRLQSLKLKLTKVFNATAVALMMVAGAVVGASVPQQVQAASSSVPEYIPTTGNDFWLTFMQNGGSGALDLQIIAIPSADGNLWVKTINSSGVETERLSVALTANEPYKYSIPAGWRNTVYNTTSCEEEVYSGLHVTSDVEITLYMRSKTYSEPDFNSFDYSIVLPQHTLGTDYVVHTYHRDEVNTEFAVVGTENNTKVTIVPSWPIVATDGETELYAAGDTIEVTLSKGEVFQCKGLPDRKSVV